MSCQCWCFESIVVVAAAVYVLFFLLSFSATLPFFCALLNTRNYSYRCAVCVCNQTDLNLLIWQTCLDFSHVGSCQQTHAFQAAARHLEFVARHHLYCCRSVHSVFIRSLILFHTRFLPPLCSLSLSVCLCVTFSTNYFFFFIYAVSFCFVWLLNAALLILWSALFIRPVWAQRSLTHRVCVCVFNIFRSMSFYVCVDIFGLHLFCSWMTWK